MSWIAAGVIAGSTLLNTYSAHRARKQAREDQIEAEKQSRKAEVFAQTEGDGVGQLGQISLEVDEDEELNESTKVRNNLSI